MKSIGAISGNKPAQFSTFIIKITLLVYINFKSK